LFKKYINPNLTIIFFIKVAYLTFVNTVLAVYHRGSDAKKKQREKFLSNEIVAYLKEFQQLYPDEAFQVKHLSI
jgi:hypothetical protein